MARGVTQFEAVGLALTGYTLWVLVDTSVKLAGASRLPFYEIAGLLGLTMALLLLVRGLWRRDLRALWPRDPARQAGRASLDLINNLGVVIALRHLPLPLFYILVFCSPMVTTLLAAVFLGERLEWRKGLAILTGFLGVAVALNPLGVARPGDWIGYLACAACVSSFSVNMVWSRRLTQTETPESLTFCSGALMAVVTLPAVLWHGVAVDARLAGLIGAAGLFGLMGSLCFFVALKHAPAASVSQYHYSQLVTGSLLAYAIWRERVTPAMLAGAVLIAGAGVYTAARSFGARAELEAEVEAGGV